MVQSEPLAERKRDIKGLMPVQSKFLNLSEADLEAARGADLAIKQIGAHKKIITFDWFRSIFKSDNDLKDELAYGTAILATSAHLNQYLYTYGLMIQSQWENVSPSFEADGGHMRLIDYGCGQGLAGILLLDNLGDVLQDSVKEVILIEPSICALVRAEAVYRNLFPSASITCIASMLDDLDESSFKETSLRTLHVFSNVLDVQGFDQGLLFNKTFTNGTHAIAAVSHDRDFAGGSDRIRAVEKEIRKNKHSNWLTVSESTISEFTCGKGGKFDAISWIAALNVKR